MPEPAPAAVAAQVEEALSLNALKERPEYAALDKQAARALARAAETRWPQELSGFTYQRVERFSAGGVSHWMSIWSHDKTGLEFNLLPGSSDAGGWALGRLAGGLAIWSLVTLDTEPGLFPPREAGGGAAAEQLVERPPDPTTSRPGTFPGGERHWLRTRARV